MANAEVLCIEDDSQLSLVIAMHLQHHGVRVTRAFTGMEGYSKALHLRPSVIISDLTMPDGDGSYILYRLRSHPLTCDIPFIVLTGKCNPGLQRSLLAMGADAYLRKPLIVEELLAALRQFIPIQPRHQPVPAGELP